MEEKRRAGEYAASLVQSGMTVGLGTGSTVYWAIEALGAMVRDGLAIRGVATSGRTEEQAGRLGIPLVDLNEVDHIDLTIDGADEVSPDLTLIKGGGGALLREKLVAAASNRLVIVVDSSKRVEALGRFPLPVEVVPFGWRHAASRVAELGCRPILRMEGGNPFVTDNGNFIIDCPFGAIRSPADLERSLKAIPGVVESGLFVGMTSHLAVGHEHGVEAIDAAL